MAARRTVCHKHQGRPEIRGGLGCSDPDAHGKGLAAYVAPCHHQMLVKIMFMELR